MHRDECGSRLPSSISSIFGIPFLIAHGGLLLGTVINEPDSFCALTMHDKRFSQWLLSWLNGVPEREFPVTARHPLRKPLLYGKELGTTCPYCHEEAINGMIIGSSECLTKAARPLTLIERFPTMSGSDRRPTACEAIESLPL
jgi:hypothetical protein